MNPEFKAKNLGTKFKARNPLESKARNPVSKAKNPESKARNL